MTGLSRDSSLKHIFRKQLVLPAEHGSWAWFLVPFSGGVLVAGRVNVAILLVFMGGMCAFLIRQPALRWLRIRQGKGRRADESLAAGWTLALGIGGTVAFLLLLFIGGWALLWLLPPLMVILAVYLVLALRPGSSVRNLYMELAGAAGLAAAAPAAVIAGTGAMNAVALWLWGLFAAQNVLGALYVRQRIADTHRRPMNRNLVFLSHLAVLLLLAVAVFRGDLSGLVLAPFVAFSLRAGWMAMRPRPVANIKQFGFLEVAVEIGGGLFYVWPFV